LLLAIGLIFTAIYFVYQMKSGKKNFGIELAIGLLTSIALGFGTFFLIMSFGLYL
jgi:hypothetical protein